jgi:hypothetical protein
MDPLSLVVGCAIGLVMVAFLLFGFMIIRPWRRVFFCCGQGSMLAFVGMRLRGHPVSLIVDAYLTLLHSGAIIGLSEVESHYVANQSRIVSATDLVNSIREDPVDTHVAVWLEGDDAEWLGTRFSEYASALRDELGRNAKAENGHPSGCRSGSSQSTAASMTSMPTLLPTSSNRRFAKAPSLQKEPPPSRPPTL